MRSSMQYQPIIIIIIFLTPLLCNTVQCNQNFTDVDSTAMNEEVSNPIISSDYFVENKNQWNPELKYICKTEFGHIGFGVGSIYFNLVENIEGDLSNDNLDLNKNQYMGYVLKYSFHESNQILPIGIDPSTHKNNYFLGNDSTKWILGVQNFEKVIYKNIWDNIDLEYYFSKNGLKYDIILHPGANPKDISFKLFGHSSLSINHDQLTISTPINISIYDSQLIVHYKDDELNIIESEFIKNDENSYSIKLMNYDNTKEIIIDPVLNSTFVGGIDEETGYDVEVDSSENIYVTGRTWSMDFPTSVGSYDNVYDGNYDGFIFKLDRDMSSIIYSTFIGGIGEDMFYSLEIDEYQNAYVTGLTRSSNFPTTENSYQPDHGGDRDIIALKLNSAGSTLLFSTYIGKSGNDRGMDLCIDSVGNSYITGDTSSENFPVTSDAFDDTFDNSSFGHEAVLIKIAANGTYLDYSTFIGGDDSDRGMAIKRNEYGEIYITGSTRSLNFPTTSGAFDTTLNGFRDVFVIKFNSSLHALEFSTFIGGWDDDIGLGIDIDSFGNSYITGQSWSPDFPTTSEAYDKNHNGGDYDGIIFKLNDRGTSLYYSSYIGSTNLDISNAICVNSVGEAFFVGYCKGSGFPTTEGAYSNTYLGGFSDIFLVKMDQSGSNLKYSTYLGGNDKDMGWGICLDSNGKVIIVGITKSSNFPTSDGAFDNQVESTWGDVFVTRFSTSIPPSSPQDLNAVSGNNYVNISWNPPISNGDDPISNYVIYRGIRANNEEFHSLISNELFFNDTYVINGQTYYYKIKAKTSAGEGLFSDEVSATPRSKPSPPRNLTVTSGDHFIRLKWTSPDSDGGFPVFQYNIYKGNDNLTYLFQEGISSPFQHYNDTTVENGLLYYYYVTAVNIVGESMRTKEIKSIPYGKPTQPTNITNEYGDGFINISWDKSIDNGGLIIEQYNIYRDEDSSILELFSSTMNNIEFYNDTTVENGITYYYFVTAINQRGESNPSETIIVTSIGYPSSPQNIQIDPGDNYIELTWNKPDYNGGSAIIQYNIVRSDNEINYVYPNGDVLSFIDADLENGKNYTYYIVAINSVGESVPSETVTGMPVGLPTPPLLLTVIGGDEYVTLSWLPPQKMNGAEIIGYHIYRSDPKLTIIDFPILPKDKRYFNDTTVENGVSYVYFITAVCDIFNQNLESQKSDELEVKPSSLPNPPEEIIIFSEEGIITLSWLQPVDKGGLEIIKYNIYRSNGSSNFMFLIGVLSDKFSYIDEYVENGVQYLYSITAVNEKGESQMSDPVSGTPRGKPSSPKNIAIMTEDMSVYLSWEEPENDGGTPIIHYQIYRGRNREAMDLLVVLDSNIYTYKDDSVDSGKYYYYIISVNDIGESPSSKIFEITIENNKFDYLSVIIISIIFFFVIILALVLFLFLRKKRNQTVIAEQELPMVANHSLIIDGSDIQYPTNQLNLNSVDVSTNQSPPINNNIQNEIHQTIHENITLPTDHRTIIPTQLPISRDIPPEKK